MKEKLKFLFRWAIMFIFCFAVIYIIVLFGGWKLFNSGDPILIEIGMALVLSIFLFAINEVITNLDNRINSLEERINELENN